MLGWLGSSTNADIIAQVLAWSATEKEEKVNPDVLFKVVKTTYNIHPIIARRPCIGGLLGRRGLAKEPYLTRGKPWPSAIFIGRWLFFKRRFSGAFSRHGHGHSRRRRSATTGRVRVVLLVVSSTRIYVFYFASIIIRRTIPVMELWWSRGVLHILLGETSSVIMLLCSVALVAFVLLS